MDWVWLALQESSFAQFVRNSVWFYPAANILHLLMVMVFFSLVAAMDLALLRVLGDEKPRALIARLRPFAIAAFLAIAATGNVLLAPEAVPIAGNAAFQLKLAAIALALANVGLNAWMVRTRGDRSGLVRVTAGASLVLWLSVAAMGRSIAYF
ncbi:hypothetical protein [Aestuariivirga sp.]|uniref:hypothetical protein n=1 Tax=Aestuariivirga sp. TaxID=2650926 RepID=UPI0035934670